jgi:hypothetical protein
MNWIKDFLTRKKTPLFFVIIITTAVISIWWTFTTMLELSGFAAAFGKAVIGISLFFATDQWLLRDIETINELKKGNTAYAIFILSYALILAACIASA